MKFISYSLKTCNNAIFQSSDCSAYKATYCSIKKAHTMCKYCGTDTAKCNKVCSRGITAQADKDTIVKLHNKLRKKVARGEESRVQSIYFSIWTIAYERKCSNYTDQRSFVSDIGCWWRTAICIQNVQTQVE